MRALIPTTVGCVVIALGLTTNAAAAPAVPTTYRAHDYAGGQAMSVLPPGENGLVTADQAAAFEATGQRPPASQDQLGKYKNLLYGYPSLTDAGLGQFFDDESFGVKPSQSTRTEGPGAG